MTDTPQAPQVKTTPQELLDLPLPENDSGAGTVRGYLAALLAEVWREEEGFSGKRPFGSSSWQGDLYRPLAAAGIIGDPRDDRDRADELILAAIASLGETPAPAGT